MESDHADAVPPPGDQPPAEPSPQAHPPSGASPLPSGASPPPPPGGDPSPSGASPPSPPGGDPSPSPEPPGDDPSPPVPPLPAGDGSETAGEPSPAREPHILLVHAVIRASREHDAWSTSGGPRPQLPRAWADLWRNAVRRQTDLAGEPEEEARRSVQTMLDQLTRLDREAGWFRTDPARRDRAIAETLLYGTRLGPDVPSRPAQLAWQRQRGLRPVDYAKITAIAAAQDEWLAAWNEWAST
ncbi:hypothetical protein [Actinoplanes xinjiangensis]|uniref:Uncharacterized protein n=1 Tax=Actinoplanes xinjiangensis TaxID=512350 RepID=A0A316G974_9ACTN|nr:hypothetical protein [Actinoplanes xinjiangensis]PWK51027.1 hypothetical protein BC793_10253 [Actinoplanes xinjiangensis]GIF39992.1 hypothetical protein Axi01nite_43030 [Actinoplanes xinjiangensis]